MLICVDRQQVANTDKSKCSPNFKFCVILDLHLFGPTGGFVFVSDWREIGQTLLDLSWRRYDIRPFARNYYFQNPMLLRICKANFANTRRIFGILKINHASQHAFVAAWPGKCC